TRRAQRFALVVSFPSSFLAPSPQQPRPTTRIGCSCSFQLGWSVRRPSATCTPPVVCAPPVEVVCKPPLLTRLTGGLCATRTRLVYAPDSSPSRSSSYCLLSPGLPPVSLPTTRTTPRCMS